VGLGAVGGPAILGPLTIGNGDAGDGMVRVDLSTPDQIADFVSVLVNSDGQLNVLAQERIADLTVSGGVVSAGIAGVTPAQPASLALRNLTMTGGVLESLQGALFLLGGAVTAVSTAGGPAVIRRTGDGSGAIDVQGATRAFTVNLGPSPSHDLEIGLTVRGAGGLTKDGAGRLRFTGSGSNTYTGTPEVRRGRLELAKDSSAIAVPAGLQIGAGAGPAVVELLGLGVSNRHNIADASAVSVTGDGVLLVNSDEGVGSLSVGAGGRVAVGQSARSGMYMSSLLLAGGRLTIGDGSITLFGDIVATSTAGRAAVIDGSGAIAISGNRTMFVLDGPEAIDLVVATPNGFASGAGTGRLTKRDPGVAQISGSTTHADGMTIENGTLLLTGVQASNPVAITGGVLAGAGRVGAVTATLGRIAPGNGVGRLGTGALTLSSSTTVSFELNGPTAGVSYDQLAVAGTVALGAARLDLAGAATLPAIPTIVLVVVSSDLPIVSERSMYWRGESAPFGEGHNSSGVTSLATRWGLAEGRVGGPRDFVTYILLANPGATAAQVEVTLLPERGAPIVRTYTVPPTSRFNIDVRSVAPELGDGSFGALIETVNGVPIAVERSMYWNAAGVFWAGGSNALGTPLP
jgi:autotransporter-associated beta strand protein